MKELGLDDLDSAVPSLGRLLVMMTLAEENK